MTWPVFAVLQLALCLIGACIVFALHHRRLARENDALREACASAAAGVDGDEAWHARVREKLAAATGEEPIARIQRLILGNELQANAQLADELAALLGDPEIAGTWTALRKLAWEEAAALGGKPGDAARTAFERYAPLDEALGYDAAPWPDPVGGEDASEDENEQAALHAEITALKEKIAELESGKDDEELRKLLKQFTQDSREMMGCIQDLEKENATLKAQIEQQAAA